MDSRQPVPGQSGSSASETPENLNPYDIAQQQFDAAAQYVPLPAGLLALMRGTARLHMRFGGLLIVGWLLAVGGFLQT